MSRRRAVVACTVVWLALAGMCGAAEQKHTDEAGKFIRLGRSEKGDAVALEVSIVKCVPMDCSKDRPTVDLISAVHVAEPDYYDRLNKLFKQYDAVLYELVAPEGITVPQDGARSGHPVSMLQQGMTRMLELEFQLDGIDYRRANLIHADMSAEQFAESMKKRGESMFQVFFRLMGYAMAQQADNPAGGDVRLLVALFSKNRALALKRVLAEQMEDLEGSLNVIDGPEGSTLISERNKVALKVLRKQLSKGKNRLAIFYGAGHMPDFIQRLRDDFGLAPIETRWLAAWDLTGSK